MSLALLIAAMVCSGALAGEWRLGRIDHAAALAGPAGTTVSARAILLEHPRPSLFGSSAAIQIVSGRASGARMLARMAGHRLWPDGGQPGSVVRVAGTTETPAAGDQFDWRAYLRRRGIAYELALDSVAVTGSRRGGALGAVDAMRRRAEAALGARLAPADAALARGMVLGEDQEIDALEREDFRLAGL
jgi:competence protein ComEC